MYATYTGLVKVQARVCPDGTVSTSCGLSIQNRVMNVVCLDVREHSHLDPRRQYQPRDLARFRSARIDPKDNRSAYGLMLVSYDHIMTLQKETKEQAHTRQLMGYFDFSADPAFREFFQRHEPGTSFDSFVQGKLDLAHYQRLHRQFGNFNAGVDILYYTQMYLQFLYEVVGRVGINDDPNYVALFNVPKLDNAFYTPTNFMIYGSGDKMFRNLASPDTVAHELTHGLTKTINNLEYKAESGALNEHASDAFAKAFEDYLYLMNADNPQVRGETDWEIGEDVTVDFRRKRLRDMNDPSRGLQPQPSFYRGKFWSDTNRLDIDHGGVHINSGVPNRLYRLVTALYDENSIRSTQLFYECYCQLNKHSTFQDLCDLLAARDPNVKPCLQAVGLNPTEPCRHCPHHCNQQRKRSLPRFHPPPPFIQYPRRW